MSDDTAAESAESTKRHTPDRPLTLNLSVEEREAVFSALLRGIDDMRRGDARREDMAETAHGTLTKILQEGYDE